MKSFRQHTKPQARPKKQQLLVGDKAIMEAFRTGIAIDKIYQAHGAKSAVGEQLMMQARQLAIPIQRVPIEKLNAFNVTDHQGWIAIKSKVVYQDLQSVISFVVEKGEAPLLLILDGITDVRNIGAIARTAYCCGVHAIIIPEKGVGALNEDAILTSAGALEQIAICRVKSLMKAVDELRLNGIRVFASEMTASTSVFDCNFIEPAAIVMGGEEHGIHPALMKICDQVFKIPMNGSFESLNVSVATGMILYEAMKQRR